MDQLVNERTVKAKRRPANFRMVIVRLVVMLRVVNLVTFDSMSAHHLECKSVKMERFLEANMVGGCFNS